MKGPGALIHNSQHGMLVHSRIPRQPSPNILFHDVPLVHISLAHRKGQCGAKVLVHDYGKNKPQLRVIQGIGIKREMCARHRLLDFSLPDTFSHSVIVAKILMLLL